MEARLSGLKVVALAIAIRRRAIKVEYGMYAQDSGFSSMQLWRSWDFRQSRREYMMRRLVTTHERTRFRSYSVWFYKMLTGLGG